MTNIETPEGWERQGPCFTRVYDGKFAVLHESSTTPGVWFAVLHGSRSFASQNYLILPDAVAWANDQLGVPKPVVLVETEFSDGSVLIYDTEKKRSARVSEDGDCWCVDALAGHFIFARADALETARRYVRGEA